MVYRIYVEKKEEFALEAGELFRDIRHFLAIEKVERVRVINRYDAEGLDEELFRHAVGTVFSEPQVDMVFETPDLSGAEAFAVEYLPGQFDQRADSAAQCIQLISHGEKPVIRSAKVYAVYGDISAEELDMIRKYVINPVEAREASFELPGTLRETMKRPRGVRVLEGFTKLDSRGLSDFIPDHGLAMDMDDLAFCQAYFISEKRDPTLTEIRVIDTYWSDHCRHTTFGTIIDEAEITDEILRKAYEDYLSLREEIGDEKPVCLMDIATIGAKVLRKRGLLERLDESEEINACTVKTEVSVDGEKQPWLLLFKNETHNHPTEIEPFGGAATCIGGAIRDPLAGRAYVYAAMRVTGAADPLRPLSETIPGKLPQRKIVREAANGYSSYGNQIGLATGMVNELYHPGYAAKRMEIGAVLGAVPKADVVRLRPEPGDKVIYLGGSTGRDGIGGATGSSKAHNAHSVEECGAEVQKGNAPEERKLQRLFRNPQASRLIKRCNDFGAGGVAVAIGELAAGLDIDLTKIPRKYEGLDATELSISESQERMAVLVASGDAEKFMDLAAAENLNAVVAAEVKSERRLRMSLDKETVVDLSRDFLDTNGAKKHISVKAKAAPPLREKVGGSFGENLIRMAGDLSSCSQRGLAERFDSTIGAGTVLMPFGGRYQLTPIQAMAHLISVENGHTGDCSVAAWGFDPYISEQSPFHGAYLAVCESAAKLIASGADLSDTYLSFQEYFEKPGRDPERWGQPFAALLGALRAQTELSLAAIGGKDSMSGSFEDLDVPPTLVSFAFTTAGAEDIVSGEFKAAGHRVLSLTPVSGDDGLPLARSLKALFSDVHALLAGKDALSAYVSGPGGAAAAVFNMCLGNMIGFHFDDSLSVEEIFSKRPLRFVVELSDDASYDPGSISLYEAFSLGETFAEQTLICGGESVDLTKLLGIYEGKLGEVFPLYSAQGSGACESFLYTAETRPRVSLTLSKPRVAIPVFPGTNCEYDSALAMADAGADPEIFVIKNLSASDIARSAADFAALVRSSQMIFIPGGFSGGDEPDGSGKFITAFFRSAEVKEAVTKLLDEREGLILGVCNGFQALVKLGLVPYGRITEPEESSPTLTFNTIGRHQSRLVRTRIASDLSPWLSFTSPGEVYTVPISCGEGRFIAEESLIRELASKGQIATQYVDLNGIPTADIHYNPSDSMFAIEGITSPDGRVFGKMGHTERKGEYLYKNVPGVYDLRMYEAAVRYFRG